MSDAEKTIINAFMEGAAEIERLRREVTRLQMENAELKARLIEGLLPNPAPFKLNPAMEALMKEPKPQGEE